MQIRKFCLVLAILFVSVPVLAQEQGGGDGGYRFDWTAVARIGTNKNSRGYRLVESYVTLPNGWIPLDVGYIDFHHAGHYREPFIGFGKVLFANKRHLAIAELYYTQAFGSEAAGDKYLQPWGMYRYSFTGRTAVEAVYFPYLALNESATAQHVLERLKLEHKLNHWFAVSAGTGAYKFGGHPVDWRPFVGVAFATKDRGSYELWLQRWQGGVAVQLRFEITKHKY